MSRCLCVLFAAIVCRATGIERSKSGGGRLLQASFKRAGSAQLYSEVRDAESLVQWGEAAVGSELPLPSAAVAARPQVSLALATSSEQEDRPKGARHRKKKNVLGKKHGKGKLHKRKKHHKRHAKGKGQQRRKTVGLAKTTSIVKEQQLHGQTQQEKTLSNAIASAAEAAILEATEKAVLQAKQKKKESAALHMATGTSSLKSNLKEKVRTSAHGKAVRTTSLTSARTGTRHLLPWKQWVAAAGGQVPGDIVKDEQEIQQLEHTNDQLAANYKGLDKEFKQSEYSQEELNARFDQDQARIAKQQALLQAGFLEIADEEGEYKSSSAKAQDLDRQLITQDRNIDKAQQVVELKAKTEGVLRGQLQQLKEQLGDNQKREATMDQRVEQELRNSTKMLKSSKITGHALAKQFKKLQFRLNATASDKEQLKEQRVKLVEENQRLTLQGSKIESLRREQEAEKDALQHALENGQQERGDLQHELDILEAGNGTVVEGKKEQQRVATGIEPIGDAVDDDAGDDVAAPKTLRTRVETMSAVKTVKQAGAATTKNAPQQKLDIDQEEDKEVDAALEAADDVTDKETAGVQQKAVISALQGKQHSRGKALPKKRMAAIEDLDY